MPTNIVLVDQTVAADDAEHEITLPTGSPPIERILYARQIDNGTPAEVDLSVVDEIDGDDQVQKEATATNKFKIRVGTAIATDDLLILNVLTVGERIRA